MATLDVTGRGSRPRSDERNGELQFVPAVAAGPAPAVSGKELWRVDLALLALAATLFALFLTVYAFDTQLSEWDLYLAALGLWDGYHSGQGIGSPLHYGKWHSFGYVLAVYALGAPDTFGPGGDLFRVMNLLGFWATVLCLPLLWAALAAGYGRKVAWPATAIFIGSPVFLELAGGAHPLLLALAALLGGTILLWYRARGAAELILRLLAAIVLCLALTIRLEVALAFPLLVLAPPAGRKWKPYLRGCLLRLGVTVAACAGFLLARSQILARGEETSTEFVEAWYRLENIPIGIGALSLAVGLASMVALAWAGLRFARTIGRSDKRWTTRLYRLLPMLGPLAVIGATFIFWIANPLPARHFLLLALGAAIVIAVAATAGRRSLRSAMVLAAVLIAGNQLLSALVNPYVVQASGFAAHRGWPYLLTAPSGFAWDRRAMLKEKWTDSMQAARLVASGRCGQRVIVSAQLSSAVVAQLVSERPDSPIRYRQMQYGGRPMTVTEVTQPVHVLIYTRRSLQEPAFPTELLHDASLSTFRLAVVTDGPGAAASDLPRERLAAPLCARIAA